MKKIKEIDPSCDNTSIHQFAHIILDLSIILLESGAHCERINRNIQRVVANTPYEVDLFLTFTAVSVTIYDPNNPQNTITANRAIRHHSVHFGVLTETSLLTWQLFDKEISFPDFMQNMKSLKKQPKYSVWLVRFFIGIACGCLCLLSGGNWIDSCFTIIASFVGLTVRQELIKADFNMMISIISSAFITTTISGLDILFEWGKSPSSSVATSVLFLIPGVPLINCVIDIIEGYIPIGLARGTFGGFILLCIATGMFLSINLIGINNF